MPTKRTPDLVVITADTRRIIREARARVGLSRAVLEQRAKLGTDYVKKVELGQRQRTERARLRRLLQVVQNAVTRGQVPATVTARVARVLRELEKASTRTTR